jgi:hypothetical protein
LRRCRASVVVESAVEGERSRERLVPNGQFFSRRALDGRALGSILGDKSGRGTSVGRVMCRSSVTQCGCCCAWVETGWRGQSRLLRAGLETNVEAAVVETFRCPLSDAKRLRQWIQTDRYLSTKHTVEMTTKTTSGSSRSSRAHQIMYTTTTAVGIPGITSLGMSLRHSPGWPGTARVPGVDRTCGDKSALG